MHGYMLHGYVLYNNLNMLKISYIIKHGKHIIAKIQIRVIERIVYMAM